MNIGRQTVNHINFDGAGKLDGNPVFFKEKKRQGAEVALSEIDVQADKSTAACKLSS